MKKINNTYYDENIIDIAKEGVEAQKRNDKGVPKFVKGLIIALIIFGIMGVFVNPLGAISPLASAAVLISSTVALKKATAKSIGYYARRIASIVNDFNKEETLLEAQTTLAIEPVNLRIGENLEASNAIDIFKKGHYVIIKSLMDPYFIRSYVNDEGVREEYLMEPTEEDIYTLTEELPDYEKYIKMLNLKPL